MVTVHRKGTSGNAVIMLMSRDYHPFAAPVNGRLGAISIHLSWVLILLLVVVAGNARAAIEVGLAIENGIDGKGVNNSLRVAG